MRDMSASLKVVRIAAVCWASTSRWAIRWRSPLMRWRVSRGPADGADAGAGAAAGATAGGAVRACGCSWPVGQGVAGRGGAAAGAGGAGAAAAGDAASEPSTSPLVIRPPGPVPAIRETSTFCSATSRRTDGESGRSRRPDACGTAAGPPGAVPGRSGARRPPGPPRDRPRPPPHLPRPARSSRPSRRSRPSPPRPRRSSSTPEPGAGTMFVALSVSSSRSGSPACTGDPSAFSQRETMPSEIDSPTLGTVIGTAAMGSITWVLLAACSFRRRGQR